MKQILRLFAFSFLIVSVACGEVGSTAETLQPTSSAPLLVVVFDPTIFEVGDKEKLQSIIDKTELLLDDENQSGGRTVLFAVNREMLHASPVLDTKVELDDSFEREANRELSLSRVQGELAGLMKSLWGEAHSGDELTKANSCIRTALQRAGQFRRAKSHHRPAHLLVLSDLLEVCSDGQHVNFESNVEVAEQWRQEPAPDLAGYDRVWLIQTGNRHQVSPEADRKLKRIWCDLLARSGLAADRYGLQQDFPDSFATPTIPASLCEVES